ncbi:MAG: ComEC/Rec2 family competence protein [Sphingobacteriales bacterium]|nr:ComEC/Rec2 family competence protein [Sphingobacteriales bacterium]
MIAYFKTEIPFLRLLLFFISGISLAVVFNLPPSLLLEISWLILFMLMMILSLSFRKSKIYLHSYLIGILIYTEMLLSGIVLCGQHKEIFNPEHFSKFSSDELVVIVSEEPQIKGDIARFNVEVKYNIDHQQIKKSIGKLLLAMRFDTTKALNINYGDKLLIKSKYNETEPPYNPAEFNYKRYLSFQQVEHQSFIHKKQTVKLAEHQGNFLKEAALNFRKLQVEKFRKYLPDADAQAVAATLILGYRANLSRDILDAYSKTGTMHVLSVSGMHVAIVVLLLDFLLRFLDKNRKAKMIKAFMMIALVWFYSFITGLAPSVERAAIMLTFILLAKAFGKKVNIFNIIAIAAFIILIENPFAITNVGFQLSFIAVSGLIYLQPKIYDMYRPQNKFISICWSCISVSVAAQLATAPISLYYFHQFPLYFIISNLFIALPAVLIMYTGIAFLAGSFSVFWMKSIGWLLNELIEFTNAGLFQIEQIHYANITQIWFSFFEIVLFYLLLFFILQSLKQKRYLKYSFSLIFILVMMKSLQAYVHMKQKQITFFSLRKNTAIALIEGRNALLITDLQPDEYTFQFSIKPYLDSCQIQHIQLENPHLTKSEKLYTFDGHQLKIIHQSNKNLSKHKLDWLLLSGDEVYDLKPILKQNTYKMLFIDGKNRDFVTNNFKEQLTKQNLSAYTLKRNFAIEIKTP